MLPIGEDESTRRYLFQYYFSATNVHDQVCHPTRDSAQSFMLLTAKTIVWLVLTAAYFTAKRVYMLHIILRIRRDRFPKQP
jgi:hypothetical protein